MKTNDCRKHPSIYICAMRYKRQWVPSPCLVGVYLLWVVVVGAMVCLPRPSYFLACLRSGARTQPSHTISSDMKTNIEDIASTTQSMYPVPARGVYFSAAYSDTRQGTDVIRLFGIHRNDTNLDDFRCEWNSTEGVTWQVRARWQQIDPKWPLYNKYFAFMMTCKLPPEANSPRAVHVGPSGANGVSVPVHRFFSMYIGRLTLGVCVKPITGQFSVSRVTEWVELNLAAGYQHFVLYDTDLQGASRFVLDYYESKGVMTVIRFPFLSAILEMAERQSSLDGGLRYALYQQVYLVALHDCLYRFRPSFKFLTMIDLDEVILPAQNVTITDVIRKAEGDTQIPHVASYMFYTSWHFQEFSNVLQGVPEFLYMQRHAFSPVETLDQPKSIMNTDRVLTVNWHGVLLSLDSTMIARFLLGAWNYACVHHFRSGTCKEHFHDLCLNMTLSVYSRKEVTRYRQVTEHGVLKVLDHLKLR